MQDPRPAAPNRRAEIVSGTMEFGRISKAMGSKDDIQYRSCSDAASSKFGGGARRRREDATLRPEYRRRVLGPPHRRNSEPRGGIGRRKPSLLWTLTRNLRNFASKVSPHQPVTAAPPAPR